MTVHYNYHTFNVHHSFTLVRYTDNKTTRQRSGKCIIPYKLVALLLVGRLVLPPPFVGGWVVRGGRGVPENQA
jgi:hypothetical protein